MIELKGIIGGENDPKKPKEKHVHLIDLISAVKEVPETEPVHVLIDSIGGDIDVALSMYDYLRSLGRNIITECTGMCASAATIVFLAGDKRIAGCPIMIHNPWIKTDGNAKKLREVADWIASCEKRLEKFYSEKTGQNAEVLSSLMDVDTYMSTSQAITLGFATEAKQSAMALININNPKTKKMAEDKKKAGFWTKFGKAIASLDGEAPEPDNQQPTAYNMELLTEAGEVLTIDREDGAPEIGDNASPDGTFVMPDGTTIVVADGVITEITPAEVTDDELAQAKAEIEDLKAQLAQSQAQARTKEDLQILNTVKMAGGLKALGKIQSTYVPPTRPTVQKIVTNHGDPLGGKGGEVLAKLREQKKGGQ